MQNAELTSHNGLGLVNIPVNKASLSRDQIDELDRARQEKEGSSSSIVPVALNRTFYCCRLDI